MSGARSRTHFHFFCLNIGLAAASPAPMPLSVEGVYYSNHCVEHTHQLSVVPPKRTIAKSLGDFHLAPPIKNDSQTSVDTYTDTPLPPGLLYRGIPDVDDPPIAKPTSPCRFTQAKLDGVKKVKQASIKHAECFLLMQSGWSGGGALQVF